jgi:hypothetical protein
MPGVSEFIDKLRATGIEFFEIPSLDRRRAAPLSKSGAALQARLARTFGGWQKTSSKPEKDLRQAAALIEALVERYLRCD